MFNIKEPRKVVFYGMDFLQVFPEVFPRNMVWLYNRPVLDFCVLYILCFYYKGTKKMVDNNITKKLNENC